MSIYIYIYKSTCIKVNTLSITFDTVSVSICSWLLVPRLRYPGDEQSWNTGYWPSGTSNPEIQAIGSWVRYLGLGTLAEADDGKSWSAKAIAHKLG